MIRQIGLGSAVALLLWHGAGHAQSSVDQSCSVAVLETNAASALDACTSVLAREDLSDAVRVSAMKVQSRALHRLGRLDEAIRGYEGALHLAPTDPELHLRRGWTAYHKRDFNVALDHGRQALKIQPGYAEAHDLVGAALSISIGGPEQFAAAKTAYDEAIRLDPSKPLFRFHRYLLLKGKYPKEALQELDDLLQLPAAVLVKSEGASVSRKDTSFRVAGNLGRAFILQEVGRPNEARQAYDKAVNEDPEESLTYAWRAEFNLVSEASEEVVQADLDKSFALDAQHWFARYVQARVHFYSKRYDAAATDFALAAKQVPNNGDMRWWQARTLRELGRVDEASAQAIAAFRVDPNFIYRKASALQKRGYLVAVPPGQDPWPAIDDAARACMLDKDCG